MKKIILGSASPRRRELLEQIGIEFEVKISSREEIYTATEPEAIVKELALEKASHVSEDIRESKEAMHFGCSRRFRGVRIRCTPEWRCWIMMKTGTAGVFVTQKGRTYMSMR